MLFEIGIFHYKSVGNGEKPKRVVALVICKHKLLPKFIIYKLQIVNCRLQIAKCEYVVMVGLTYIHGHASNRRSIFFIKKTKRGIFCCFFYTQTLREAFLLFTIQSVK